MNLGIYRKYDGKCFEVLGYCTNADYSAQFVYYKQCKNIGVRYIGCEPFYHSVPTELNSDCIWLRTIDSFTKTKIFEESVIPEPKFKFITSDFCTKSLYPPNQIKVISQNDFHIRLGPYRHYKGAVCEVIGLCRFVDSHEELLIYLDADRKCIVTQIELFFRQMDVEGKKVPRFEFVCNND